jgi:predicted DNA-binding transcriptional regulator AlpA
MMQRPYSAIDVCEAIGISLDTLYRTRQLRHHRDQLPRPISETGRLKWERSGFDAWLTRHHPARPPRPANDVCHPLAMATDDEHRARLALAYPPQKPALPLDTRRRHARG